jgi:hypothetical protein
MGGVRGSVVWHDTLSCGGEGGGVPAANRGGGGRRKLKQGPQCVCVWKSEVLVQWIQPRNTVEMFQHVLAPRSPQKFDQNHI